MTITQPEPPRLFSDPPDHRLPLYEPVLSLESPSVRCDPVLAGILKHYFSMVSLDAIEFKPLG